MRRAFTALVALALVSCLLAAASIGGEAFYVGAVAPPQVVAEYHFGSESMIAHGGWAYRSRSHYLAHGLLIATPFAIGGLVLARLIAVRIRRSAA